MSSPSPQKNTVDTVSSLGEVLDFLSERWVLFAISSLMGGPRHFNELGRDCGGASGKVLIQKLEKMEQLGIVRRTVLSISPPRTTYSLTPAGFALRPTIEAVDHWARTYLPTPLDWNPDKAGQATDDAKQPIQLLQQKWVLRIVHALLQSGGSGYNELGKAVGVNVTTLGHRLRELEEAHIITKTVVKTQPLQHRYTLTEAGTALKSVVDVVKTWLTNERFFGNVCS